ncbi:RHS repeat domain-containing protein, partial [Elizabethkingia meningoseptica]
SAYVAAIIAASDLDHTQGTDQSEQALISALDIFRNNPALSGYQISTYTYNPLIGVTSITPPSGIREIYKYDAANRLESVKDVNGNILKEYQYRYKN